VAQLDVVAELRKGPSFEHAVICTYEFDAAFFERSALRHFTSLRARETITIATDVATYQSLCHDSSYSPTDLNRLYLVQDFAAKGVFHPKVLLLVSPKRGKLFVGSANFTSAGLTTNAEMVAAFTYENPDAKTSQGVFQDVYDFLRELALRVPATTFASNIEELGKTAPWLVAPTSRDIHFVHNLKTSLLEQMVDRVGDSSVGEFVTVSPFFDRGMNVFDAVREQLRPQTITIVTQDETTTLPTDAVESWRKRQKGIKVEVKLIEFPAEERFRSLHAKLHILRAGKRRICLFGSPNCTAAALLSTVTTGNVETGILVDTTSPRSVDSLLASPVVRLHTKPLSSIRRAAILPELSPSSSLMSLRLLEAVYEGSDTLRVAIEVVKPLFPEDEVLLELVGFMHDKECIRHMSLAGDFSAPVFAPLGLQDVELLETTAVRGRLVVHAASGNEEASNWRWVENLTLDGRSIRIARAIRDASEDPVKFDEMLHELTKRDDVDAIISFLTYCNIPVEGLSSILRVPFRLPPTLPKLGPLACRVPNTTTVFHYVTYTCPHRVGA